MVYRKILAGFDGSPASLAAVEKAADIARGVGAELIVLSVVPPPSVMLGELMAPQLIDPKPLVRAAEEALAKLAERLEREKGVKPRTLVVMGDPGETIVDVAGEEGVDLIVVGRRGLSRLERLFVGSVTKKVLERAHVDVLVVVA